MEYSSHPEEVARKRICFNNLPLHLNFTTNFTTSSLPPMCERRLARCQLARPAVEERDEDSLWKTGS